MPSIRPSPSTVGTVTRSMLLRNTFLRTVLNIEGSGDHFNRQGSPCLHRQDSDRAAWGLARAWGLAEECEVDEAIAAAAATTAAKNATVLAAECSVGC